MMKDFYAGRYKVRDKQSIAHSTLMKKEIEDAKLAKMGHVQRGTDFHKLFEVDFSKLLEGSTGFREKFKGVYKIGRLYRFIERIPRAKLNFSVFEKGMAELSNVHGGLTDRTIPTSSGSTSGTLTRPTSTSSLSYLS
jgi:hypothetical protein